MGYNIDVVYGLILFFAIGVLELVVVIAFLQILFMIFGDKAIDWVSKLYLWLTP